MSKKRPRTEAAAPAPALPCLSYLDCPPAGASPSGATSSAAHSATMGSSPPAGPPPPQPFFGAPRASQAAIGVNAPSAAFVSDDVQTKMRELENKHRVFNPRAGYIKSRAALVEWITEAGEAYVLGKLTPLVAIGYMDRVLQQVNPERSRLLLVAAGCLILAAKYEEAEESVPSADSVVAYLGHQYPREHLLEIEKHLLSRLSWSCTVVTPLHYLGIFAARGMLFSNDLKEGALLSPGLPKLLTRFNTFLVAMTVKEYQFYVFSPSLLAAAIVLASRKALKVTPVWNPALEPVLGYTLEAILPCLTDVWTLYAVRYADQVSDTSLGDLTYCPAAPEATPVKPSVVPDTTTPTGVTGLSSSDL